MTKKKQNPVEVLNRFFRYLAGATYDHRFLMTGLCLVVLAVCGYLASSVCFDNSFESFFDKNDPVYKRFLTLRDDFGSDEISYILYEAPDKEYGAWDMGVMKTIQKLTKDLETKVPFVKRVVALPNVEFMEGKDDTLYIHDLLSTFPKTQDELLEIRDKVLAKPVYVNGLASSDGRYGAIILDMVKSSIDPASEIMVDPNKGNQLANLYPQATDTAIENILEKYEGLGILFHHTGDVPLNAAYNTITQQETASMSILTFAVIGLVLLVFFRSVVGVIGPLSVVACSVVMTVGFMGAMGWQFDFMFVMLPAIIVCVGVADSVHLISDFKTHYMSLQDRRKAIRKTAYLTGVPCLFTSLTTMAGFMSMSISHIVAIKHFAIYSGLGVAFAFMLSMTLLVVFLSYGKKKPQPIQPDVSSRPKKMAAVLSFVADVNIRHKHIVVAIFAILFVVSATGVSRIIIDSNLLAEFSDRIKVKRTTEYVDRVMGGSISYSYIFDTGVEDGVMEPRILAAMEKLQQKAEEDEIVLKTSSIVDIIKDINRSLHNGDNAYYTLPDTLQTSAQYFFLYEMSGGDEIKNYVTSNFSRANLEIRTIHVPSSRAQQLVDTLDSTVRSMGLTIQTPTVTGMGALWYQLIDYILDSQLKGFTLAFIVITLFMCTLFRSVKVGLLSMIPNLSPVVLTLGMMGWVGIELDYVKLLIGCIAIGIAVDDTIHLVSRYRYAFALTGDYEKALHEAMAHVGKALTITSLVLVLGFLVLTTSVMASMVEFAILVAATLAVALIADFFLLPSLILIFKPFDPEDLRDMEGSLGHVVNVTIEP